MSPKFNVGGAKSAILVPPVSTGARAVTYEGATGWEKTNKEALFSLAATMMGGSDTFYETGESRHDRFIGLVHTMVREDPEWLAGFVPFLRNDMFMRSYSLVSAAEYLRAVLNLGDAFRGPRPRRVIASAIKRMDEPGEMLAYWASNYGRAFPMALKRGVADALARGLSEYSAMKYDGGQGTWRLGDVVELTHPKPAKPFQDALYRYLLDHRHHADDIRTDLSLLPMVAARKELYALEQNKRRALLRTEEGRARLAAAGITWEALAGWLNGPMDAEAWEAVIPVMGYMALLRNLRNFDQAGVSDEMKAYVAAKLSDPEEVARSMQFPYRFLTAHKQLEGYEWASTLDKALNLSTSNIPKLRGRTLILIDVSGSMRQPMASRSRRGTSYQQVDYSKEVCLYEVGALFAIATLRRTEAADVVAFGTDSERVNVTARTSVLRGIEAVAKIYRSGHLDYGTEGYRALKDHYDGQDRVIIFTDMQYFPDHYDTFRVASKVPLLVTFDLAGYAPAAFAGKNVLGLSGFSDAVFTMLDMVERGKRAEWPWIGKDDKG